MAAKDNKELVRSLFEKGCVQGNLEAIPALDAMFKEMERAKAESARLAARPWSSAPRRARCSTGAWPSRKTTSCAWPRPSCATGSCNYSSCSSGWGDCNGIASDGCEADLATEATNCGFCGRVCATPPCTA